MTPAETAAFLRQFNEWRRGDEDIPQPDPRVIGEAIDAAVEMIDRLEAAEKSDAVSIAMYRKARDERDALRAKIEAMERQAPSEQDASVRKAWARFSHELHRSPDAPYPGMADAFEQHFSQSFIDREWKAEAATWAAAWKAAKRHCGQPALGAPSVPECPYPCGWRNLLKHAIEDGAYLARSINEDEPVTENARAVTMRMVTRLRDVLMAVNNAAPEFKP